MMKSKPQATGAIRSARLNLEILALEKDYVDLADQAHSNTFGKL